MLLVVLGLTARWRARALLLLVAGVTAHMLSSAGDADWQRTTPVG